MIVAAVAIGLYVRSQNEPHEKRGSAKEEFVTTEERSRRPRRRPEPGALADLRLRRRAPARLAVRPPPALPRLWTIDAHNTLEFPPTLGYGRVYLAQQKGLFFALNAKTGRVCWRKRLGRCAASSPTVGKGVVYQS